MPEIPRDLALLAATAAALGFVHTLLGPDHYLPFIALARARGWSPRRAAGLTLLCGAGHVASSVVLGLAGIGLGVAVSRLEAVEAARGDLAAWLLLCLGLLYGAWGLHRASRSHAHRHLHDHSDQRREGGSATPWMLFILFVLGPCEPLIPVLMYPAAVGSAWGVALVTATFATTTLATMLAAVTLGTLGLARLPLGPLERYNHALAGASLCLCGLGIHLLGL